MGRPYRMFALSLCSAAVLAMILAFLFAARLDGAIGTTFSGVQISQPDTDADAEGAIAALEDLAARENALIVTSDYDLVDGTRTNLYVLDAGRGSEVLATGHRQFTRGEELETLPLAPRMSAELAGGYNVVGPDGFASEVVRVLDEHGVSAHEWHGSVIVEMLQIPSNQTLLLLSVLTVIVLTAAATMLSSKRYAISRLNGSSIGGLFLRDLAATARYGAAAFAATVGAGFAALYAYNQFAEVSSFWFWLVRAWLLLLIVSLLAHWIVLLEVCATPLAVGIKGRVRQILLVPAIYAVRVAALLVGVSIITGAVAGYQHYQNFTQENAAWQPHSEDLLINMGGPAAMDPHDDRPMNALGAALHEMEATGQVKYADRTFSPDLITADIDALITINASAAQSYLTGVDVTADLPTTATRDTTIVIPPRYDEASKLQVLAKYTSDYDREGAPPPRIVVAEDYRLFYPDTTGGPVLFDEPAVVIRADAAPMEYVGSLAGRGAVLLTAEAAAGLEADPRAYGVLQFNSAYDTWQASQSVWVSEVRKLQFNAVISAALLMILAVASVIVYELRNAQRLRIQFVSGWSPLLSRRWLWAGEALLFAFPFALLYRSWRQNQAVLADPLFASMPSVEYLLTAVTPLTVTLVTILALIAPLTAVLAIRHREQRLSASNIQK
ncbi:hypothetical protein IEU95_08430 [Hoyosella rhizosphaerae]|uniref:hypothetical protein n=1 Tax=Hoyosella rhizosphaerae TaxID=1755582 RepID=UPI00166C518A|nr:hypothetical protein [Hoyosella rhizosphaerae]MBN4926854.1 hypothetical protein [Hoyosella rhizosphaerae]